MHPFVSGMGMVEMDAGCGPSRSKGVETGAGQEAGCQTRASGITTHLVIGLRQRRRPLSTASLSLRPTRPCRCIRTPIPLPLTHHVPPSLHHINPTGKIKNPPASPSHIFWKQLAPETLFPLLRLAHVMAGIHSPRSGPGRALG